jgi:hypothetical protein
MAVGESDLDAMFRRPEGDVKCCIVSCRKSVLAVTLPYITFTAIVEL